MKLPICIAGMHRSGTSMVARLLNLSGLYLGPECDLSTPASDNRGGFWENHRFVEMNDRILASFDGAWDLPPTLREGWELRPEIATLRTEAAKLIDGFTAHEHWGWKDPRNSLTLPFWTGLIPGMKVLVCIRNPLEVSRSLYTRNFSSVTFGLKLWQAYSQRLLSTVRYEDRVVTHYDAYFSDPVGELRRVLDLLGMPGSRDDVERACLAASDTLRHHRISPKSLSSELPPDIFKSYLELCAEAGPVYEAFHRNEGADLRQQLDEANCIPPADSHRCQNLMNLRRYEQKAIIHGLNETITQPRDESGQWQETSSQAGDLSETLIAEIYKQETVIRTRDLEISSLQNDVSSLRTDVKELHKIKGSLGWRLLSRYGPIKYRFILPIFRMLRVLPNANPKNPAKPIVRET